MTTEECSLLGTIVKTHGYSGRLVLKVNIPFQGKCDTLESVFLLIDGILVPFFVEEFEEFNTSSYLIKIDEINSKNEAAEFLGKEVFLQKDKIVVENDSSSSIAAMVDYELRSQSNNNIGIIKDVLEIPGNPLFILEFNGNELMVPANANLILKVNQKEKFIVVTIPDGLLPA